MTTAIIMTGLITAALTIMICLPQVSNFMKTKFTQNTYTAIYIAAFATAILWILYAVYMNNLPLIVSNAIAAELSGVLLYLKINPEDYQA